MRLSWLSGGWEDYLSWQKQDKRTLRRISELIRDAMRSTFDGIVMPEPLRGNLSRWWSCRITAEHRLVYRVEEETLVVMRCRFYFGER